MNPSPVRQTYPWTLDRAGRPLVGAAGVVSSWHVLGKRTGESDERAACRMVPGPKRRFTGALLERTRVDGTSKSERPSACACFHRAKSTGTPGRHGEVVLRRDHRHRRLARGCAFLP